MKKRNAIFEAQLSGAGLTKAEFGRLVGKSATSVSGWATGRHPTPDWVGVVLDLWADLPAEIRERRRLALRVGSDGGGHR